MKKRYIFILLAIFIVALGTFFFLKSVDSVDEIREEIVKANYCSVKSDCVILDGKCPFGCYLPINKKEVEYISGLVEGYESNCVYSCIALEGYECIEEKCVLTQTS